VVTGKALIYAYPATKVTENMLDVASTVAGTIIGMPTPPPETRWGAVYEFLFNLTQIQSH
jgi:hypothetical protein